MSKLLHKKVLITGASGFLATYLADACSAEGATLFGVDIRPPFNPTIWKVFLDNGLADDSVEYLFKDFEFDIIFHLAGSASVGASVQKPEADFLSLLPPTFKLIQLVSTYCAQAHFILFSSAAVYGNPDVLPITESSSVKPVSPYGIHKALVESMLNYYSKYYKIRSSTLRIFSAFGEGLRKQIFWDVMGRYKKSLAGNIRANSPILELFGTGHESRDFIHSSDVAKAAILIALHNTEPENYFTVFNVANGVEVSIQQAIESLFLYANPDPRLVFSGNVRTGDPEKWCADISKLKSIGYNPNDELEKKLSSYFEWFMQIE